MNHFFATFSVLLMSLSTGLLYLNVVCTNQKFNEDFSRLHLYENFPRFIVQEEVEEKFTEIGVPPAASVLISFFC